MEFDYIALGLLVVGMLSAAMALSRNAIHNRGGGKRRGGGLSEKHHSVTDITERMTGLLDYVSNKHWGDQP